VLRLFIAILKLTISMNIFDERFIPIFLRATCTFFIGYLIAKVYYFLFPIHPRVMIVYVRERDLTFHHDRY